MAQNSGPLQRTLGRRLLNADQLLLLNRQPVLASLPPLPKPPGSYLLRQSDSRLSSSATAPVTKGFFVPTPDIAFETQMQGRLFAERGMSDGREVVKIYVKGITEQIGRDVVDA
jgi:hypothetical protein